MLCVKQDKREDTDYLHYTCSHNKPACLSEQAILSPFIMIILLVAGSGAVGTSSWLLQFGACDFLFDTAVPTQLAN